MPNLASTTLAMPLTAMDRQVQLASTTGILVDQLLVIDGEAMRVRVTPKTSTVYVLRGQQGTQAVTHTNGATVYSGNPTQFYTVNPRGVPVSDPPANPWINLTTGAIWFAVGDQVGPNAGDRVWQPQTSTPTIASLGVRPVPTLTPAPTASS